MQPVNENELLNKKIARATQRVEKIMDELSEFIDEIDEIKEDAQGLQAKQSCFAYPGLNFLTLRNAMCSQHSIEEQTWVPKYLATAGGGPWDSFEFDEFLRGYGFDLYSMPGEGIECLIVGAFEWDEEALTEQIYNRSANDLKIYTQELFVLGLIVGQDPYAFLEQEAIDEIGEAHSAIKYILGREFTWPSWPVGDGVWVNVGEKFIGVDWAQESVLKAMGYSANANGPDTYERQEILRRAFERDIPPGLINYEQRERWGIKKSADRLYAISHFIAWLIGFQGTDKPAAKAKWESDLEWLKRTYYSKTMKFRWPTSGMSSSTQTHSPKAAWPFAATERSVDSGASSHSSTQSAPSIGSLRRPNNALARIIGAQSVTYEEALSELKHYISDRNLDFDGRGIRCDQPLFALSGKASLQSDELGQLISSNLH